MMVATFGKDFKLTLPTGKELIVTKNKKYIFSDFVLKQFIDAVIEKSGQKEVGEMVKNIEELDSVFPVLDLGQPISELKKIKTLLIIRTGGIGDLLALSNVAKLANHIFRDILKVPQFKIFFITDQKYAAVFKYFDQMVTPIYYFYDPVDKVLKKNNIYGTSGVRSIYFEGLIEEREDNWFDLQIERFNLRKFELMDKIDPKFLVKNPKLTDIYSSTAYYHHQFTKKNDLEGFEKKFKQYESNGTKTVLVHHRASAWIRSFNIGDAVNTLSQYFKDKGMDNYKIITFPRNYTESDNTFFENLKVEDPDLFNHVDQIKTENLHQFFYTISKADIVLSSDTAAFHFKEGIGGFAIGIYSSFPSRMRTRTYVNTHSYDIIFPQCKFVCDKDTYIGCVSHFKTPYEVCVYMSEKYRDVLKSDHHFKRGNRIPDKEFLADLESFVKEVGMDTLLEQGIFQYAPCLSSRWNDLFTAQLRAIFEKEDLVGRLSE